MKKGFRILAAMLCALMLIPTLAACGGNGEGSETTVKPDVTTEAPGTTENPGTTGNPDTSAPDSDRPVAPDPDASLPAIDPTVLEIIKDRKTEFTVIYGADGFHAKDSSPEYLSAQELWAGILKKFKIDIQVKKDTEVAADGNAYEILIGDTNRPESDLAIEFAKGGESFVIKAIGNKLVINAYASYMLDPAVAYFVDEVAGKSDGKNLTFASENDYVSSPVYTAGSRNCAGYPYGVYTIVVPENAKFYEERAARIVQSHLALTVGELLPIVYDSEEDKISDFEILVGQTNRTKSTVSATEYVFALHGARIEINAGSVFAMDLALRRVESEEMTISFYNDAEYDKGDIERVDVAEDIVKNGNKSYGSKGGDYRIISNNVWGWNENTMPGCWNYTPQGYNSASQRNKMMAEVYMALDPDIILLQEYTSRLMRVEKNHPINAELEKNGFVEVPKKLFPDEGGIYTATPIFYKTEKFDLVKNGCMKFAVGGGHDKFLTWAVLQEKGTDNKVLVSSVHHAYQGGAEGENYRNAQVPVVIEELNMISEAYGNCPIILGGDFNCNYTSTPYSKYKAAGFESVNKLTDNSDEAQGYYGGPLWNDVSNTVYMAVQSNQYGPFSNAIDHVIFKGSGITFGNYDILTDGASSSISDHMPIVVDFSFDK